jgi:hypothetical protein
MTATPLAQGQSVWYVDDDGDPQNGCTSWEDACPELQTALDIVEPGDQIWVAVGTYLPDFDVETGEHTGNPHGHFRLQDGVAMYGGFEGWEQSLEERSGLFDDTILSGDLAGNDQPGFLNYEDNTRHVVLAFFDVDETCILDGFTITAGHANLSNNGSGLRNLGSSPTVANCTFIRNLSGQSNDGVGVFNDGSGSTFTNCRFIDNASGMFGEGVGMYNKNSNVTLTDCLFQGNTTGLNARGGGMFNIDSDVTLTDCVFDDNYAFFDGGGLYHQNGSIAMEGCSLSYNESFFSGAGMYYTGQSTATLVDCLFLANIGGVSHGGGLSSRGTIDLVDCRFVLNQAQFGGGMAHWGTWGPAEMVNCLFVMNSATGEFGAGGGLSDNSDFPPTLLHNCLFVGNTAFRGGALHSDGDGPISSCTFAGNSASSVGGAVWLIESATPSVSNSVFWNNTDAAGSGESSQISGELGEINHSCVQGWSGAMGGVGNHGEDPLFADPVGPDGETGTEDDDLRLLPDSPCIDAGDNAAVPEGGTTDLDGNPRFIDDPIKTDVGSGSCPVVDMGVYEYQVGTEACCLPDLDEDGAVAPFDLAILLDAWGPNPDHASDLDNDGNVGPTDLALLLNAWGPCPE